MTVRGVVTATGMCRCAGSGIGRRDPQGVFINMVVVDVMQMALVQVVRMIVVRDGDMTTPVLVAVRMGVMGSMFSHGNLLV
jgi:hypothetical protein